MKLSIIIPVYNAEKYIEECLASIIPEMDDDIELLLLDDGSKDSSYQLIQKYQKGNVHVFHHENQGVSYTRNKGIMRAIGDYVLFVDSDDKLIPGWKEAVLPECIGTADVIYYSQKFANPSEVDRINIIHGIFGILDSKCDANMSSPCSKLYRREFLLQNLIKFDDGLINGEDGIFNLNVILKAKKFLCRRDSYYCYRVYNGSSSKRYSVKFYDSNLRYFSLAENLLKNNNVVESEISRCMSYAVTYSVYLYLFLLSSLDDSTSRKEYASKVNEYRMREYMKSYSCSGDCNKVIQIVYWLSEHNCIWGAEKIIDLRNGVKRIQEKEKMKWMII